jgi:hypothetical protein
VTERQLVPATPLAAAAGLSRVLVQRTRMAMRDPAYSYSLYVPEHEAPSHVRSACRYFTILSQYDGRERFIDFAEATRSSAECAMPRGWDRYQRWLEHERAASREALTLARTVFPELDGLQSDSLPTLWIFMPGLRKGTHADAWLAFAS